MSRDSEPWQPGEKVVMKFPFRGSSVVTIDRVTPSGRAVIGHRYFNPCLGGEAEQRGSDIGYYRGTIRRLAAAETAKLEAEQARKYLLQTLYNKLSHNAPYNWRGDKLGRSLWHKLSDEQLQDLLDTINKDD